MKKCCGDGVLAGGSASGRSSGALTPPREFWQRVVAADRHARDDADMSLEDTIASVTPNSNLKESNDYEAEEYLEAHELFTQGVAHVRKYGDIDQGKTLIATAFLLDSRSLALWHKPGPVPDPDVPLLTGDEFKDICEHTDPTGSLADRIFDVILAFIVPESLERVEGQAGTVTQFIQRAVETIDGMLRLLEEKPYLEGDGESGVLGGLFRRPRLLALKAHLMKRQGNIKKCVECLTRAIELGSGTNSMKLLGTERDVRFLRAMQWSDPHHSNKSMRAIHDEFQAWLEVSSPDHRDRFAAHAMMARFIYQDPSLGTYEDAVSHLERAKASAERQRYLYGNKCADRRLTPAPPYWSAALRLFPIEDGGAGDDFEAKERAVERRALDDAPPELMEQLEELRLRSETKREKIRNACVKCGSTKNKDKPEKECLSACSCGQVSYCGVECQHEDWASHKTQCKMATAAERRRSEAKAAAESNQVVDDRSPSAIRDEHMYGTSVCFECPSGEDDAATKTRVERNRACLPGGAADDNDNVGRCKCRGFHIVSRRCDRMEAKLGDEIKRHGEQIADWWHGLSRAERVSALRRVTDHMPENGGAYALVNYNEETLSGECACRRSGKQCMYHRHGDFFLHDLWERATRATEVAEREVWWCQHLTFDKKILSKSRYSGKTAFFQMYEHPDRPLWDFLDGEVTAMVVNEDRATPDMNEKLKMMFEKGFVVEANALWHAHEARVIALHTLMSVVQLFHVTVRHENVRHEFGKVKGCEECGGAITVEEGNDNDGTHHSMNRASCCGTCAITWWCSASCRRRSQHNQKCDVGSRDAVLAVQFSSE